MFVLLGCTLVLGVITGLVAFSPDFSWRAIGQIIQGLLSVACFALVIVAFWRFGWKLGLLDLLLVFVGGNIGFSIYTSLRRKADLMSNVLAKSEQERILQSTIALSLDNFSLAWRVVDLLIEYAEAGLRPPSATIRLVGEGRSVEIPGTNCGLFTTPVIQMAILDSRRTLEFFGITRDSKSNSLKPITKRQGDDLGIEHFGLPLVSPRRFVEAISGADSAASVEPLLLTVHQWSNKQLAHFTLSDASVTLGAIRDVSKAMIQAYLVLLFDALGRERPTIQPKAT